MANAKKYDKLSERKNINLDGHVHFYTNPRPNSNVWYRDPGRRDLMFLLGKAREKDLGVVCLTNAGDDWNYERYFAQAKELPEGLGYFEGERLFQVIDSAGVPTTFIKTEETFPEEGHILFWGVPYGEMIHQEGLPCKDMLDKVKGDSRVTVISDHPFFKEGLGVKGNLKKYLDYFDALEWNAEVEAVVQAVNNPMWRFLFKMRGIGFKEAKKANLRAIKVGNFRKKSVLYNSDCHLPSGLGSAYNIYYEGVLNFGSEEDFLCSLKCATAKGQFKGVVAGKTSLFEVLSHAANVKLVLGLERVGSKHPLFRRLGFDWLYNDRVEDSFEVDKHAPQLIL